MEGETSSPTAAPIGARDETSTIVLLGSSPNEQGHRIECLNKGVFAASGKILRPGTALFGLLGLFWYANSGDVDASNFHWDAPEKALDAQIAANSPPVSEAPIVAARASIVRTTKTLPSCSVLASGARPGRAPHNRTQRRVLLNGAVPTSRDHTTWPHAL